MQGEVTVARTLEVHMEVVREVVGGGLWIYFEGSANRTW